MGFLAGSALVGLTVGAMVLMGHRCVPRKYVTIGNTKLANSNGWNLTWVGTASDTSGVIPELSIKQIGLISDVLNCVALGGAGGAVVFKPKFVLGTDTAADSSSSVMVLPGFDK